MTATQLSDRLCGCGCGAHTWTSSRTNIRAGIRRGDPLRFLQGHNSGLYRRRGSKPTDRPCDPATLDVCDRCEAAMHLIVGQDRRTCEAGHTSTAARHLCLLCFYRAARAGDLVDYPRRLRSRDDLLDEWEWLRGDGVPFDEFPRRMNITPAAWERAFLRARKAGDPRAVRIDKGEVRAA